MIAELAAAVERHLDVERRHHNALEVYLMQCTTGRRELNGPGFAACEAERRDSHYEVVLSLGSRAARMNLEPRS